MLIFSKVKLGVTPDINALATVIILLVSAGVILAALLGRRPAATGVRRNPTSIHQE
jgi:putrescine transport system permease protein